MFPSRITLCLLWGRWMAWWWSVGEDTMLMTWLPQRWQWSQWSLCTGGGKFKLHLLTYLLSLISSCMCTVSYLVVFLKCFSRIAVFSVSVLHDERIVVVAEQRPDASEEDSFQWMSRVLQVKMEKCIIFRICVNPKIVNKCSPSVLVSPPQTITTQQTSFLMCGFLYRLLTASIRWASTV